MFPGYPQQRRGALERRNRRIRFRVCVQLVFGVACGSLSSVSSCHFGSRKWVGHSQEIAGFRREFLQ